MPRSSSSRSSSGLSRSFSSSRQVRPTNPAPVPPPSRPPAQPNPLPSLPAPLPVAIQPPGFLQTMKEGFGFGFGASVARNVVDNMFGRMAPVSATAAPTLAPPPALIPPPSTHNVTPYPVSSKQEYDQCMKDFGSEDACKQYLE